MKAKVTWQYGKFDGMVIEGRSLTEIQNKMKALLEVDGPRGLTAETDDGQAIHVSLNLGQDYIRTKDGRIIK